MMFEKDPEVVEALIAYRQERIRAEARRCRLPRNPSRIREAIGLALIHAGERMRGCTRTTPADALPTISTPRMRSMRHA